MKTNFLANHPDLNRAKLLGEIIRHSDDNGESRTAKAWDLTQRFYRTVSDKNATLITDIYKWSFQKSSLFSLSRVSGTLFFRSQAFNNKVTELTLQQIETQTQNPNSRTAAICRALGKRLVDAHG